MQIHIKIGTMPQDFMYVYRKHKLPTIGETIKVRKTNKRYDYPYRVNIYEIRYINGYSLYFASRI